MNTKHFFKGEIAMIYDVETAVFLHYLHKWYVENKTNKRNYYKRCYWVVKSMDQWRDFFTYFSEGKIRKTLKRMLENKLIKKVDYNQDKIFGVNGYTLTEKAINVLKKFDYDF